MNNQEKKELFEYLKKCIDETCITTDDLMDIAKEIKSLEEEKKAHILAAKKSLVGRCFMYINAIDCSRYYFKVVSAQGKRPTDLTALFFREGPGYFRPYNKKSEPVELLGSYEISSWEAIKFVDGTYIEISISEFNDAVISFAEHLKTMPLECEWCTYDSLKGEYIFRK